MITCSVCSGKGVAQYEMVDGVVLPISCPVCCGRGEVDDHYCEWLHERSRSMFIQQKINKLDIMAIRIGKVKAGLL